MLSLYKTSQNTKVTLWCSDSITAHFSNVHKLLGKHCKKNVTG